jgi:hypothetical protein
MRNVMRNVMRGVMSCYADTKLAVRFTATVEE